MGAGASREIETDGDVPSDATDPRFSAHWSQIVLAVLLGLAVAGLVLHAIDARRDERRTATAVAQLEADSQAVIEVQRRALDLYDAIDGWEEGGPFGAVESSLGLLDQQLDSTDSAGTSFRSLVRGPFIDTLTQLRPTITGRAPDVAAAYPLAENFERAAVGLSRNYEELLSPERRTEVVGDDSNEKRGMRLVLLVILLGLSLGTITVLRSRSAYRAAKERFDRDREELDRASVLERGEAEILAGIVEGEPVGTLVVSVLDLAHRLTGGCLRFVVLPGLDVDGMPEVVVRSLGGDCRLGSSVSDVEPAASWPVSAGAGLELGTLELCAGEAVAPVDDRIDAVARRCADLIALVIDRVLAEEQLRYRATHDSLTGMPNREHLLEVVAEGLRNRAADPDHEVALIFCDLDRFKLVNDTLGHRSGDELIRAVGRRMCASVNGTGTVMSRLGGDEFVAVCTGPSAGVRAAAQAADLVACLQSRFVVDDAELFVTGSFGIAVADDVTATPEQLLRNADMAMYAAKRDPLATVVRYDANLETGLAAQLEIDVALRETLARDGLTVYMQPLFDVGRELPVGVESLVRWEHDGELLTPAAFLPVARANGLMGELGRVVVSKSLDALRMVREQVPDLSLWLNMDRLQLRDAQFPALLAAELERTGVPAANLVLELSEEDLLHVEEVGDVVTELRAMGVRLAMDDFGTGYSSIVRLTELPVDIVKLDRALVAGLAEGGERAEGILAASVALVTSAGLDVVVEGVETQSELDTVRSLGCAVVQGYLLRRPGPAAEVLAECVGRTVAAPG